MKDNHFFENNPPEYHTGLNTPPKRSDSVVAFVLMTTIFLSGIVTLLSYTNLSLSHVLFSQQEKSKIPLTKSAQPATAGFSLSDSEPLAGEPLSDYCRNYYDLPQGICLNRVDTDSVFYTSGLRTGDILTQIEDAPIEDLTALLERTDRGEAVQVTLYRDGKSQTIVIGE